MKEKMACHWTAEAFRAFDRWCAEHYPDGVDDVLEAAVAYSTWAKENSIEPYLDAARAPAQS